MPYPTYVARRVKEREGFSCRCCGYISKRPGEIHAHTEFGVHLIAVTDENGDVAGWKSSNTATHLKRGEGKIFGLSVYPHPDREDDGMALCVDCHQQVHEIAGQLAVNSGLAYHHPTPEMVQEATRMQLERAPAEADIVHLANPQGLALYEQAAVDGEGLETLFAHSRGASDTTFEQRLTELEEIVTAPLRYDGVVHLHPEVKNVAELWEIAVGEKYDVEL